MTNCRVELRLLMIFHLCLDDTVTKKPDRAIVEI